MSAPAPILALRKATKKYAGVPAIEATTDSAVAAIAATSERAIAAVESVVPADSGAR